MSQPRAKKVHPRPALPSPIHELIGGSGWKKIASGKSRASCYRVLLKSGTFAYLKIYPGDSREEALHEIQASDWLKGKFPAAQVRAHAGGEKEYFVLLDELPGKAASQCLTVLSPDEIATRVAEFARTLHQLDIRSCELDQRLDRKIAAALLNAERGRVVLDDLDEERKGWTLDRLKKELLATRPKTEDLVFTHGDFTLANMILNGSGLSGLIDLGRTGVADRYQDLALILRELQELGATAERAFLSAYGLARPDPGKLEFYQLLDEFF